MSVTSKDLFLWLESFYFENKKVAILSKRWRVDLLFLDFEFLFLWKSLKPSSDQTMAIITSNGGQFRVVSIDPHDDVRIHLFLKTRIKRLNVVSFGTSSLQKMFFLSSANERDAQTYCVSSYKCCIVNRKREWNSRRGRKKSKRTISGERMLFHYISSVSSEIYLLPKTLLLILTSVYVKLTLSFAKTFLPSDLLVVLLGDMNYSISKSMIFFKKLFRFPSHFLCKSFFLNEKFLKRFFFFHL